MTIEYTVRMVSHLGHPYETTLYLPWYTDEYLNKLFAKYARTCGRLYVNFVFGSNDHEESDYTHVKGRLQRVYDFRDFSVKHSKEWDFD